MFQIFMSIFDGTMNFAALKDYIWTLYTNYSLGSMLRNFIASFGIIGAGVAVAVGLVALLYGKKFFALGKFLVCAGGGYFLGTMFVAPFVNTLFVVSPLICGGVCALIMGVLSKFLYTVVLYAAGAVVSFTVFFSNGVLPFVLPTEKNLVFSLAGVGAVCLLMFLMRKNIDRLVTSGVGAILIVYGVRSVFDFTLYLPGYETLANIGALAGLALLGFAFQYSRRRRY